MAARLTVIISQSPIRHSQATEAEELLLTELMMTSGMDATLIGSLDQVQPDSTDYLCLTGFNSQSLAIISALSYEQVVEQWSRLQLGGRVVRVGQAADVPGRRIYYFGLLSNTDSTLAALRQLLLDQTVRTIDVIMPLGKPARAPLKPQADVNAEVTPSPMVTPSAPPARMHSPQTPPSANDRRDWTSSSLGESGDEWPHLDQLVDDFDALDL